MLKKQQEEPGDAIVTTVLFSDGYELLHDRTSIKGLRPLTDDDYFVGGCTVLLDAIGKTIHKIANAQKYSGEEQRADKVLFVITTDGLENASREYTYDKIREMVEKQKSKYGWEFIFLGANIDAISTATRFGISTDRAANYHADSVGTKLNYEAVSNFVSELRACKEISHNWKEKIDEDFARRGKGKQKRPQ